MPQRSERDDTAGESAQWATEVFARIESAQRQRPAGTATSRVRVPSRDPRAITSPDAMRDTVVMSTRGLAIPPPTEAIPGPRRANERAERQVVTRVRRRRAVLAGLLGLVAVAGIALLWISPSVDHAEERVAVLSRAHQSPSSAIGVAGENTTRDKAGDDSQDVVPAQFAAALVATEDTRFYSDPGIDVLRWPLAAWVSLTGNGTDPGGSTLDQQLAKQLWFDPPGGGFWDTLEQVADGIKLATLYSKAQILEMYAAVTYFGHGFYGLDAAAHGYFGRAPDQLDWAQSAMLAGLVQAPSAYDPLEHLALARQRQRHVLNRLVASGALSTTQADAAAHTPLHLSMSPAGGF